MGQRKKRQRNAGTSVATFVLLSIAGGVSFVLPDSVDLPSFSTPASVDATPELLTDGPITEHTVPEDDEHEQADARRRPS